MVNSPMVGEKPRLSTYGMLEIGDVPRFALVIKATPKEEIASPIKNTIYRFKSSFFDIKSPIYGR